MTKTNTLEPLPTPDEITARLADIDNDNVELQRTNADLQPAEAELHRRRQALNEARQRVAGMSVAQPGALAAMQEIDRLDAAVKEAETHVGHLAEARRAALEVQRAAVRAVTDEVRLIAAERISAAITTIAEAGKVLAATKRESKLRDIDVSMPDLDGLHFVHLEGFQSRFDAALSRAKGGTGGPGGRNGLTSIFGGKRGAAA